MISSAVSKVGLTILECQRRRRRSCSLWLSASRNDRFLLLVCVNDGFTKSKAMLAATDWRKYLSYSPREFRSYL